MQAVCQHTVQRARRACKRTCWLPVVDSCKDAVAHGCTVWLVLRLGTSAGLLTVYDRFPFAIHGRIKRCLGSQVWPAAKFRTYLLRACLIWDAVTMFRHSLCGGSICDPYGGGLPVTSYHSHPWAVSKSLTTCLAGQLAARGSKGQLVSIAPSSPPLVSPLRIRGHFAAGCKSRHPLRRVYTALDLGHHLPTTAESMS